MQKYRLANGQKIRLNVYILETRIIKADKTIIYDWTEEFVVIMGNDEVQCLAGMDVFNACYSATNQGVLGAPNPAGLNLPGSRRFRPELQFGRFKSCDKHAGRPHHLGHDRYAAPFPLVGLCLGVSLGIARPVLGTCRQF